MTALERSIQAIVEELVAERNPAFAAADGASLAEEDSLRCLVSDLACMLWMPNRRVKGGDGEYEAMLKAIGWSARWRLIRTHMAEIQRHMTSSQEEARVSELSELIGFLVKSMVCRLVHQCPAGSVGLNSAVKAYSQMVARKEPLLNDYILVAMELARKTRLRCYLSQWINRELIQACLDAVKEMSRHKEWRMDIRLEDGDTEEKLPGNWTTPGGVTNKSRDDQIPDILTAEWRYCQVEQEQVGDIFGNKSHEEVVEYTDTLHTFGLHYVQEKCLVIERHRQNKVDVRQRVLLPLIIGAEARIQRHAEVAAQVRARRLAFEFITTAAMKKPELVDVDVVWFERRDQQWLGTAFPLQALRCETFDDNKWLNLLYLDSVLPHFFVRWSAGTAAKRTDCEILHGQRPTTYLEQRISRGVYQAVAMPVIMREDETALCVPPPVVTLPKTRDRPSSVLLATVSEKEDKFRGTCVRDLAAAALASRPFPVVEEDELVRSFITLLFGPVIAHGRRK